MNQYLKSQNINIKEIFLVVKNDDNDRVPVKDSVCDDASKVKEIDLSSLEHLKFAPVDGDQFFKKKSATLEFWVYLNNERAPYILIGPSFSYTSLVGNEGSSKNVILAGKKGQLSKISSVGRVKL